jgi:WD40 repeat protein
MSRMLFALLVLAGCGRGVQREPGPHPPVADAAAGELDAAADLAAASPAANPAAPDGPTRPLSWKECGSLTEGGVRLMAAGPLPEGYFVVGYGSGLVAIYRGIDPTPVRTLRPHTSAVTALGFRRDVSVAATAAGRDIQLFHLNDGSPAGAFTARADVQQLAFSPDGALLQAGSQVFRTAGAVAFTLADTAREGAFTPDGQSLVVVHSTNVVQTLSLAGVERTRVTLKGLASGARLSPDGKWVASLTGSPARPALWQTSDGAMVWSQAGAGSYQSSFVLGDNSVLFLGQDFIEERALATGAVLARLPLAWSPAAAAFSPTGDVVVFGGGRSHRFEYPARTEGAAYQTFEGPSDPVFNLDLTPDGHYLSASSMWGDPPRVWVWDLQARRVVRTFTGTEAFTSGTSLSRDGTLLAMFGDGARMARISDGREGWGVVFDGTVDLDHYSGLRVLVGPEGSDGRTLIAVSVQNQIALHRPRLADALVGDFMPDQDLVGRIGSPLYSPAVAVSPDGKTVASADGSLYRLDDGSQVWSHPQPLLPPGTAANFQPIMSWASFSPDGKLVAFSTCHSPGCESPPTNVLRASDGAAVRTVAGGRNAVFSPDSTLMLAGGTLTDVASGATQPLPAPAEVALFAPDWTIVAGSSDGQLHLFCPER